MADRKSCDSNLSHNINMLQIQIEDKQMLIRDRQHIFAIRFVPNLLIKMKFASNTMMKNKLAKYLFTLFNINITGIIARKILVSI